MDRGLGQALQNRFGIARTWRHTAVFAGSQTRAGLSCGDNVLRAGSRDRRSLSLVPVRGGAAHSGRLRLRPHRRRTNNQPDRLRTEPSKHARIRSFLR